MIKIFPEFRQLTEKRAQAIRESRDKEQFHGFVKVDTRLVENAKSEAKARHFTWVADVPVESGGTDAGPGPLSYFTSTLGLCQQFHYAEESALMGIALDSLGISIKAYLYRLPGHGFNEIVYETRIESKEDEEKIKELVERAENGCYVTSTLKKCLKLSGIVYLNGKELMKRTHHYQ